MGRGCRNSPRLAALIDEIALAGIEEPEDAIPLVLAEIAAHSRRSPCVEEFLESLLVPPVPPTPPRTTHYAPYYVPYYQLDTYVHTLQAYGYKEGDDIAVNATTKDGDFMASMLVSLPARFGYSNDWAIFRKTVSLWLRSLRGHYADAIIEDQNGV